MAGSAPTGRSTSVSMSDFNERAKRVVASTPMFEKPPERRRNAPRPSKPHVDTKPDPETEA